MANMNHRDQFCHSFVFVDSLSRIYDAENEVGENTPSSSTSSFAGKTPEECWRLLQAMLEADSNDICKTFVIVDARTMRDNTVLVMMKELLAKGEVGPALDKEVRVAAEMVLSRFGLYEAGKTDMNEDCIKSQRHDDRVKRPSDGQLTAEEQEKLYGLFGDSSGEDM